MKMVRYISFSAMMATIVAACGCQETGSLLYTLKADDTKKVKAESSELEKKRICIWVWIDDDVLFEHPNLRPDIANHVKSALSQQVECTFVDPATVEQYQRSDYESDQLGVVPIGRHFEADRVLHVEVSEFRTRPTATPSLFQGTIRTQCTLYDCTGEEKDTSEKRRLWTKKIDVVYPETRSLGQNETDDVQIRSNTLLVFADLLAKCFYIHDEPVDR